MAGGKFSKPRPHRDEERQIEQAFRQVTGQAPTPESPILGQQQAKHSQPNRLPRRQNASQDTVLMTEEEIAEALRQAPAQPTPSRPAYSATVPQEEPFDFLPEDMDGVFAADTPEPPVEEAEPDFIDKLMALWDRLTAPGSKKQTYILLGICAVSLIVIISCLVMFFSGSSDPNNGKILDNVIIANVNVGGMSKSEAISAVKQATANTFTAQDMVIDLSGTQLRLSPKDTGANLNVKSAVSEAYEYGRTGTKAEKEQALSLSKSQEHVIALLPYLNLKEDYIRSTLTSYAGDSGSTLTQTSYGLEGSQPELSVEKFNENTPTQTLVITLGTPGVGFDVEDVFNQVLDAYSLNTFLVTVENVEAVKEPEPVDLEAIYEEFYVEPVDASLDPDTYQPIPGSYGYGFDLEEAQKLLDDAAPGDTIRIPMEYIEPEILETEAIFQDTLGSYKTQQNSNDNQTHNLKLICQAINGTRLEPGETFSFNQVVGQRTSERGYRTAIEDPALPNKTTLGGGISQAASTLYCAALTADLDITQRYSGSTVPGYTEAGFDAVISWNLYDLTFRNNKSDPIQIKAEVSGGYVKMEILGTETRDYYIGLTSVTTSTIQPEVETRDFSYDYTEGYKEGDVIEEGTTGYIVKTYKVKYDSTTKKELSRDYIATTEYPMVKKVVAHILPQETTAPTTPPTTTAPTPETTAPPASTPETPDPEPSESQTPASSEPPVPSESSTPQPDGSGEENLAA